MKEVSESYNNFSCFMFILLVPLVTPNVLLMREFNDSRQLLINVSVNVSI